MKKILVTGYTGFIGSHLVDLLKKNYEIIGLSRNTQKNLDIVQIKGDIRKTTVEKLPKNLDSIIHMAAITDVLYSQNNPVDCFDVNVNGTQNMLEIARKTDAKFLYLSTSHVYGNPKKLPISENHVVIPTSIYAGSKIAGEVISESYVHSYGMDISIIRLFSVYGPHEPSFKVTSKIISQLLTKNTISVGNLYPKRDFIYIKDAVNAMIPILKKTRGFNIYNVGSEKSYSILDLCKILKYLTGKNNSIKSIKSQSRKYDIPEIRSNSSKIRKLGWKPKTNLKQGLSLTLEWYKAQKHLSL